MTDVSSRYKKSSQIYHDTQMASHHLRLRLRLLYENLMFFGMVTQDSQLYRWALSL